MRSMYLDVFSGLARMGNNGETYCYTVKGYMTCDAGFHPSEARGAGLRLPART